MRRMLVFLCLAACPRSKPEGPVLAPVPAPAPAVAGWHCTAYVSRATPATPFSVDGAGATEAEADTAAWARACGQLPPTDPPGGCKVEAPPDGWSWTRAVETSRTADASGTRVVLQVTPEPLPYQGIAEATTNQEQACAAAYVRACAAAGAEPGCERADGFVDGGVSAVEADLPAGVGTEPQE